MLLLKFESVKGQRLHYCLGSLGKTTANATIALLLFVEVAKAQVVRLLSSFRLHDTGCYLFILLLNFLLPKCATSKIRGT